MYFIDTHTHLYVEEFDSDNHEVINRAIESGIKQMILPAIDSKTHSDLFKLANLYPKNLFPTIGLHPTSVSGGFENELVKVENYLQSIKTD